MYLRSIFNQTSQIEQCLQSSEAQHWRRGRSIDLLDLGMPERKATGARPVPLIGRGEDFEKVLEAMCECPLPHLRLRLRGHGQEQADEGGLGGDWDELRRSIDRSIDRAHRKSCTGNQSSTREEGSKNWSTGCNVARLCSSRRNGETINSLLQQHDSVGGLLDPGWIASS